MWNPDLALVLAPTVARMYVSIAKAGGIEDISIDLPRKKGKSIVQELLKIKNGSTKIKKEVIEDDEVVKGLMSRTSEEE